MALIPLENIVLVNGANPALPGGTTINGGNVVFPDIADPISSQDAATKNYVDNSFFITNVLNSTSSQTIQSPIALDTPIRIEFGPEILSGDVTLTKFTGSETEGNIITFVTSGIYMGEINFVVGLASSGIIVDYIVQAQFDGVYQSDKSTLNRLNNIDVYNLRIPFQPFEITSPTELVIWMSRLSFLGGSNDGSLYQIPPPVPSFATIPCAQANFIKIK